MFVFFFFKQKTAYEMRISDWSSDVCSSDLPAGRPGTDLAFQPGQRRSRRGAAWAVLGAVRQLVRRRDPHLHGRWRSEEHTSELQSLMRISYAVFCLKKKNNKI